MDCEFQRRHCLLGPIHLDSRFETTSWLKRSVSLPRETKNTGATCPKRGTGDLRFRSVRPTRVIRRRFATARRSCADRSRLVPGMRGSRGDRSRGIYINDQSRRPGQSCQCSFLASASFSLRLRFDGNGRWFCCSRQRRRGSSGATSRYEARLFFNLRKTRIKGGPPPILQHTEESRFGKVSRFSPQLCTPKP
jgi:hypothetical protein